jgi:hypothetical protein
MSIVKPVVKSSLTNYETKALAVMINNSSNINKTTLFYFTLEAHLTYLLWSSSNVNKTMSVYVTLEAHLTYLLLSPTNTINFLRCLRPIDIKSKYKLWFNL